MFLTKAVWFSAVIAIVTCKSVNKREIGRDTQHYAVGPNVRPEDAKLYAYQVAFRENCNQNCGGTILSDRHILIAAHCLAYSNARPMTIKAGILNKYDPNGQIRNVFSVKTHRNYDSFWLLNDISLITLQEPLNLTGLVVAKLPEKDENFQGEHVDLSGWGGVGDLTHAFYTVKNTTHNSCSHPSKLCAEADPGMSMYSGDSGGPVVLRRGNDVILVGVVSGISGDDKQHFFSNVAYLRDWIDEAMAEGNELSYLIDKIRPDLQTNSCTQ